MDLRSSTVSFYVQLFLMNGFITLFEIYTIIMYFKDRKSVV